MTRLRNTRRRCENEAGAKKGDGRIVCALCGRTIKGGSEEQPVIYSICASCKKLPHRNPG